MSRHHHVINEPLHTQSRKLNSGFDIPLIGFGSATSFFNDVSDSTIDGIVDALKAGFRYLDTAAIYKNEKAVGEAIKKSGVDRKDIFLTTKVIEQIDDIPGDLDRSLSELQTDYVDLYLIHTPFFDKEKISLEDAWRAMEQTVKDGKARSIGISNFRVEDLAKVLAIAEIKPAALQIEYHAYLQDQTPGIVDFAKSHDITIQAYGGLTPLTAAPNGPLKEPIEAIAKKHNKTTTQILLRWIIQQGIVPVTSSKNPERVKQAFDVFKFQLSNDEEAEITKLGKTYKYRKYFKDRMP